MQFRWLSLLVLVGCGTPKPDSQTDADGDGVPATEDCNDADASVYPGAPEVWYDGVDEDCAGDNDNDQDGDGVEAAAVGGQDCDDLAPTVHPGASEECDSLDNNCDGQVDEGLVTTWFQDADGDNYGNAAVSTVACAPPVGYVVDSTDCNDTDPRFNPGATEDCSTNADYNCDGQVGDTDNDGDGYPACDDCDDTDATRFPSAPEYCNGQDDDCDGLADDDPRDGTTWYADSDADGWGLDTATTVACSQPSGYAAVGGDCNDGDANYNPGAAESCTNTTDYNCDGSVGMDDRDGDGYSACEECDDADPTINPAATEVCDGLDNNCDGGRDNDAVDAQNWYADADGDHFGDPTSVTVACSAPAGSIADGEDCDDGNSTIHPGVLEVCDGLDNDCSGAVDDSPSDGMVYYADADGDGFGNATDSLEACGPTGIYTSTDYTDCDDTSAMALPGGLEICDSLDNDCNGLVDDNALFTLVFYLDGDGDGYGDAGVSQAGCTAPYRYVASGDDCDDLKSDVHPGATETCNQVDDDCDGTVDNNVNSPPVWYVDADGDGYGDSALSSVSCQQPSGSSSVGGDCNDASALQSPGAGEVCDNLDNDCDGTVDDNPSDGDAWYADADGDGFGDATSGQISCSRPANTVANASDCDDTSSSITDGADYYTDADGDGYGDPASKLRACSAPRGYIAVGGDCDDTALSAYPGGHEVCDNLDNDCNGTVDDNPSDGSLYYRDADGDTYGDLSSPLYACTLPSAYSSDTTDCDDASAIAYPGAAEVDNGADDDCDEFVDEDFLNPGDVIITEVTRQPYVNGTVTNDEAAWFEVYNTTSRSIDMRNWYIGRVSSSVASKGIYIDPLTPVILAANSYAVFCKSGNYETPQTGMGNIPYPLTCDYVWGGTTDTWHNTTLNLQRDEDDLYLYVEGNTSTGWLMDDVHWYYDATNGYWPRQSQASMTLDPAHLTGTDNDSSAYWCFTTVTASGKFGKDGNYRWWDDTSKATDEYGTPGAAGYDCPSIR